VEPVAIHYVKLVKEYQVLFGNFLYVQVQTFLEIFWAVSVLERDNFAYWKIKRKIKNDLQLSKYMIRPGPTHLVMAKKLLRHLKGRKNVTLQWCPQDCIGAHLPGALYRYANASFHLLPTQSHINIPK